MNRIEQKAIERINTYVKANPEMAARTVSAMTRSTLKESTRDELIDYMHKNDLLKYCIMFNGCLVVR